MGKGIGVMEIYLPPEKDPKWKEHFIDSKHLCSYTRKKALESIPLSNGANFVSDLVLRKVGDCYVLAAYVYFYNVKDLTVRHRIHRPQIWMMLDIVDGRILKIFDCLEYEFSSADWETTYELGLPDDCNVSKERYYEIYGLLDEVRKEILCGETPDEVVYLNYLEAIKANTPEDYRRFFDELSDLNGEKEF